MTQHHDTVVVGASSGGLAAVRALLAGLPEDLPASVLVVQHQAPGGRVLAALLEGASKLPVVGVLEKRALEHGHVYVAPPDCHMVVVGDSVLATGGPRENRTRPAINPLFRTAAAERSSRVVAVLLTGLLDDGVAGLGAVKRCGGVVVVQDPLDAEFPDMPRHALEAVEVDHVLPVAEIGPALARLVREEAAPSEVPEDVAIEARLSGPARSRAPLVEAIGEHVAAACPECGGPLWQVGPGEVAIYRCHTGHAFSARALLDSQSAEIEQSLWAAVRALTERATTLDTLARDAERAERRSAPEFRKRAAETRAQAEQARRFLVALHTTRPPEGASGDCESQEGG